MKKVLFLFALIAVMSACAQKTGTVSSNEDSVTVVENIDSMEVDSVVCGVVDSLMVVDSVGE